MQKKPDGGDRAQADVTLSLDRIRDMLWNAVHDRFQSANDENAYVREVFPGFLIYEFDGKLYRLAWSMLDGDVKLGESSVEVEQQWVDIRSTQAESDEGAEMLMRLGAAKNPEGTEWDVTICEPGFTKNGWFIPDEAMRGAEACFEGVDVNLYELPQGATHVPDVLFDIKSLLVKNKVGWIDTVKHAAGVGLQGVLHFLDSAKWLGKNLLAAQEKGQAIYGLSYDCPVRATKDTISGREVFKVVKFLSADSVDIVSRPAAGGKFNRAVAAVPAQKEEDNSMKKLLDLIKKSRPDLLNGKDEATLTDQDIETLARMAMEPAPKKPDGGVIDPANVVTKDDLAVMRSEMALRDRLADTSLGLPPVCIDRIRKQFTGRAFAAEELDRAIADEKEYLAKINPTMPPAGDGIPTGIVTGGLGSFERACMAADRMFGLTREDVLNMAKLTRLDNKPFFSDVRSVQDLNDYDSVPAFSSLREMYTYFTGDPEVTGRFNRKGLPADLRSAMDINSATFSFVIGNTLGRRLVAMYRAINYLEDLLISIRKPVRDFRTQEAVLVGGFPDLSTVDPEAADYQEIAGVTDEESTYAILQKGNLLTITRKMIVNDDITVVRRLIDGLGRAARRTHAKYVWSFLTNNANCSDGTAWFTAPHGNLGAAALAHATALIAWKALAKMTEKDSGERIGLLAGGEKVNLIGPIDLVETIEQIANEEYYYTGNDLTTKVPNPLRGRVNGIAVPLLTDATDWAMLLPPTLVDIVEMGYLNGRQEPELFVADMQQSEQVFVADKIRHKIRHEYAGAVIDYRSGYKAEVA